MGKKFSQVIFIFSVLLVCSINVKGQTGSNQIIVKINYSFLNFEVINDKQTLEFPLKKVLNYRAKDYLLNLEIQLPGISDYNLMKIFPFLSTSDTVSISRLGEKVTIPPFWSAFVLKITDDADPKRIIALLDNYAPLIDYAHPNYQVLMTSPPNDTYYPMQESLNGSPIIPNAGINIEEAWAIETGKSFIKVGVHDTGIDSTHEDIDLLFGGAYYGSPNNVPDWGTDQEGHGTAVAGIIAAKRDNGIGVAGIAGGDNTSGSGVSLIDFKYPFLEDASVNYLLAGIVDGARRVGTYWDYPDNYYFDYNGNYNSEGILTDNFDYFQNTPGFGIQVANHSYVIRTDLPQILDPSSSNSKVPNDENDGTLSGTSCELCREAYLFSLKNGVINVVARGNSATVYPSTDPTEITNLYPQSFPDNWIILVGASGYDGTTVQDDLNQSPTESIQNYYSLYGNGMDIIAPGSDSIVYTTLTTSNVPGIFPYRKFNGTSSAAPHATGVVALLLSHYNKSCYNKRNLSIEDVEYILEKSATNLNPPSYNYEDLTGWGRLNAGAALKMIENSTKQVLHPDSLVSSIEISRDTISIGYREALVADGWGPISRPFPLTRNTNYKVERIKIQNTYSFAPYITSATQIVDIWPRWSSSNSLNYLSDTSTLIVPIQPGGLHDTTNVFDIFDLTPHDTIDSVDYINYTVKTSGYYYHFIGEYANVPNSSGPEPLILVGSIDEWYPIDPFTNTANIPFSMYIIDTTLTSIYDFPCDSTNLPYDQFLSTQTVNLAENEIKIFPNPTNDEVNIRFGDLITEKRIQLLDATGKQLQIHQNISNETKISLENYKNGIFFLNCWENDKVFTFKIVKL